MLASLSDLLQRAVAANIKRLSGSCKNLLKHVDALWKFVDHEGVDPTNNHAERELRPIVLWRKSSFGSKSESGDRFAERVMSVVQTRVDPSLSSIVEENCVRDYQQYVE